MDSRQQGTAITLPEDGLLRLKDILGDKRKNIRGLISLSKSTWWAGVKAKRFPQPLKLSARCTCWRIRDIRSLIAGTYKCENPDNLEEENN